MKRWIAVIAGLTVLVGVRLAPADTIFTDDFESEAVPPIPPGYIGNYDTFMNWDVIGAGVDLVGPLLGDFSVSSK
jgi:hypothetical protein